MALPLGKFLWKIRFAHNWKELQSDKRIQQFSQIFIYSSTYCAALNKREALTFSVFGYGARHFRAPGLLSTIPAAIERRGMDCCYCKRAKGSKHTDHHEFADTEHRYHGKRQLPACLRHQKRVHLSWMDPHDKPHQEPTVDNSKICWVWIGEDDDGLLRTEVRIEDCVHDSSKWE